MNTLPTRRSNRQKKPARKNDIEEEELLKSQLTQASTQSDGEEEVTLVSPPSKKTNKKQAPKKKDVTPRRLLPTTNPSLAASRQLVQLEDELHNLQAINKELQDQLLVAHRQIKSMERDTARLAKVETRNDQLRKEVKELKGAKVASRKETANTKLSMELQISKQTNEFDRVSQSIQLSLTRAELKLEHTSNLLKDKEREVSRLNKELSAVTSLHRKEKGYMLQEMHKMRDSELR